MSVINRFEKIVIQFVRDRKLIHDENNSLLGEWGAIAWGGSPCRYRFVRHSWLSVKESYKFRARTEESFTQEEVISPYYQCFIKAYLSYLALECGKKGNALVSASKMFLDFCKVLEPEGILISEISQYNVERFYDVISSMYIGGTLESKGSALCRLLSFLDENGMLINSLKIQNRFKYQHSSVIQSAKQKDKIPDIKVVNSIGSIYSKEMPSIEGGDAFEEKSVDRVACAMISILFSSPIRVGELALLSIDPIIEIRTDKTMNYAMRWRGSKGMTDNEKHIHSSMIDVVSHSLKYLTYHGDVARVLLRYYENSEASLGDVLGDYKVMSCHGLLLNEPVTLWQLGGILGFYDDVLSEIQSSQRYFFKGDPDRSSGTQKFGDLCPGFPYDVDETIVITRGVATQLLGAACGVTPRTFEKFISQDSLSIGELSSLWLDYIRSTFSGFPYRYSGEGKAVKLSQSLMIENGSREDGRRMAFIHSPFMVRCITSADMTSRWANSGRRSNNLFEKYGYDSNIYFFKSNQARHYLNTLAQQADLPQEIIARWSGRTSVEQNKVYNHETNEELDVKAVSIGVATAGRNIIPISVEEFECVTGTQFASKTAAGYCVQSLHVNPCTHLQVGLSGCTGCTKHCYIKGDVKSLAIIDEDLNIQVERLKEDGMTQRGINPIMKKWFDTHVTNVEFLYTLAQLIRRDDIPDGAVIRYVAGIQFNVLVDDTLEKLNVAFELPAAVRSLISQEDNDLSLPADRLVREKSEFDRLLESAETGLMSCNVVDLEDK